LAPTGAFAITRDSRSVVIAWASGSPSRITVARVDESLRVIDGTLHELPAQSGPDYDAAYPQLTVADNTPALLWRERQRVSGKAPVQLFMARLSPELDPIVQWSGAVLTGFAPVIVTVDRAGTGSMKQLPGDTTAFAFGGGHATSAFAKLVTTGGCGCSFGTLCPPCPTPVQTGRGWERRCRARVGRRGAQRSDRRLVRRSRNPRRVVHDERR
jgi:hypothetical protein